MGYFSNGSEGLDYEHKYCERCIHAEDPDTCCPVWWLHLDHNSEQFSNNPSSLVVKKMLTALIPPTDDGLDNEQCKMFAARNDENKKSQ